MSESDKMSYQAGEAKGEAKVKDCFKFGWSLFTIFNQSSLFQEKGNQMMEKVSNVAQSTKETCQEVITLFSTLYLLLWVVITYSYNDGTL